MNALRTNKKEAPTEGIGLYVHIPFCETKCPYCDFNTYSGIEKLIPGYMSSVGSEVSFWGGNLLNQTKQKVKTIFFGGGTPSYIPPLDISHIIEKVSDAFDIGDLKETTLESNPGDITEDRASEWLNYGVNRLSIGVQSLDNDLLRFLGRRHTAEEAIGSFEAARQAGFTNINLDLMYGLPYQSLSHWKTTVEGVINARPEHISMYGLAIEPETPLASWVKMGEVPEPDSDISADMYQLAQNLARDGGYRQYEISNWCLPEYESLHNLQYWRNQSYLGVGPGAHSYLKGKRFSNLRSPRRYMEIVDSLPNTHCDLEFIQQRGLFDVFEDIDKGTEMAETMILGLRLDEGVSTKQFKERFDTKLSDIYQTQITELITLGLIEWDNCRLTLTDSGKLLGNEVFHRFLST
tara:strand:+ start:105 stop:1325 length:1221 start_codon:yes stop_codon:yes gene_type:complete